MKILYDLETKVLFILKGIYTSDDDQHKFYLDTNGKLHDIAVVKTLNEIDMKDKLVYLPESFYKVDGFEIEDDHIALKISLDADDIETCDVRLVKLNVC